jgi:hypothetical protein
VFTTSNGKAVPVHTPFILYGALMDAGSL